jgi:phage baseplate assembly protein W
MSDDDACVRELIGQVLFTTPGDRPDQPDFGVGLGQLVFEPYTHESIPALQTTIHEALNRWLGDVIEVRDVQAEKEESAFRVTIEYFVRRSRQRLCDVFVSYLHEDA